MPSSWIQSLFDNEADFPRKLKQHLVFKSDKVTNPFKFISGLLSKAGLSDKSNDSDADIGLKEIMVRLAMMVACAKGTEGIVGLMGALEESGNLQLVHDFRTWVKQDFNVETESEFRATLGDKSAAQTPKSQVLTEEQKNINEMSIHGAKLIDKIMSHVEDDFIKQLEDRWVGKAPEILNVPEFFSSLVHQKALGESDLELANGPEVKQGQQIENVIKAACSKKAIRALVVALQSSKNEHVLVETYDWLETSRVRKNQYPVAVKRQHSQRSKRLKVGSSTFFQQPALPDGIFKIATFKQASKGVAAVQFDKKKLLALTSDGTLKIWDLKGVQEEPIKIADKVENATCFHYDEEILVLGTDEGTVHLFNARTFEAKRSVRLGERVISLHFAASTLVTITENSNKSKNYVWWMEISRPDMRLLNPRCLQNWDSCKNQIPGVCIYPDVSFLATSSSVDVYVTKSGKRMVDNNLYKFGLNATGTISTLTVGDLMPSKRAVVVGCFYGTIQMWNASNLKEFKCPSKSFQGHKERIVSLSCLNGHLLSLDQSGKLLLWSGHDFENRHVVPVPRLLVENSNMTNLVAHDRWFASCSSEDDAINIWTVPDLWILNY